MNKPVWLLGVSTLLLGSGLLYGLVQLREEGMGAQSMLELQTELEQLRAERDRLETDVRSLRAAQAGPVSASPPTAAAAPTPLGPGPAATMTRPDISPKSRRTMVRLRYGKLFKQLGLSDAQVESSIDVIAAQEERATAARQRDQPVNSEEVRARNRAELASVVGAEAAQKFDAWQQALSARMETRRVRDQLEDVGEPLNEAQLARITELLHARPPEPLPAREKDESDEAFTARFRSWRIDSREQVRAEVSSVLEPRQIERYDELEEMSRAFEKNMTMSMLAPRNLPQALPNAGRAAPPLR